MPKTHRWCRIDAGGCISCGGRQYIQSAVISHELAATWELDPRERLLFDRREGHSCRHCGMSKRVRMLAWTVMRLFPDLSPKTVLHFNQINHFHPILKNVARLVETIYRPDLEPGEPINGLINQDMTCLQFPDSSFDLAIHSDTLEHILDYERALSEVRRVLKPGGYQIYTIPLLHKRQIRQRVAVDAAGQRVYVLPPSGHGSEGEYPVVWEFGGDFLLNCEPEITQVYYDNYWLNPTVFVISERKPL